jgi:hypothetical protein
MAITRRFQTGLEVNDLLSEFIRHVGDVTTWVRVSSTQKYTGNYSLAISGPNDVAWGRTDSVQVDLTGTYQLRMGFYIRPGPLHAPAAGHSGIIFTLLGSSDQELAHMRTDENVGYYQVYQGGTPGTYIGQFPVALNEWFHFGIDVKFDGSSGWISVYKDGVQVVSKTGNTGTTQCAKVNFGDEPWHVDEHGAKLSYSNPTYLDDIYIDDTTGETQAAVVPDRQFALLLPNGTGNYSQWTGSDGDQVNNYQLVDEIPPDDDTTYVKGNSLGIKDSYTMQDYSLPDNKEIKAVIPIALARKESTADNKIKIGARLVETDVLGSSINVPISYEIFDFDYQETKPGGGSWTENDVNDAELVIETEGDFS